MVAAETDRMAREILDREIAAREEAERRAARRESRRLPRLMRSLTGRVRPSRVTAPQVEEPTLDTGELEAMMAAPSAVGMYGTASVPAPRPAAELFAPVDAEDR